MKPLLMSVTCCQTGYIPIFELATISLENIFRYIEVLGAD